MPAKTSVEDNGVMPEIRRRRSAIVTGFTLAAIIVGLGIALTPSEWGHGFFPFITPVAATLPIAATLLVLSVYPHIILGEDLLHVRNSFVAFDIPYGRITETRYTRLGMIIRDDNNKVIPATAYSGGSGVRLKANQAIGHFMMRDIDIRVENAQLSKKKTADLPPIKRTLIARNVYGLAGIWLFGILCVWLSTVTYHA
jgi:hypothetical protein